MLSESLLVENTADANVDPKSKWDVQNLHRHADYAPIKREVEPESAQVGSLGDCKRALSLSPSFHSRPSC